jgi:circadian clock protein KaiB
MMAESMPEAAEEVQYILRLYVTGTEANSLIARRNLKDICEGFLEGRCDVTEVDVLVDFDSALKDGIFMSPALVLVSPEPRAVIVGNLSDTSKVLSALRLKG